MSDAIVSLGYWELVRRAQDQATQEGLAFSEEARQASGPEHWALHFSVNGTTVSFMVNGENGRLRVKSGAHISGPVDQSRPIYAKLLTWFQGLA